MIQEGEQTEGWQSGKGRDVLSNRAKLRESDGMTEVETDLLKSDVVENQVQQVRQTVENKETSDSVKEMRAGKENSLPIGSLP